MQCASAWKLAREPAVSGNTSPRDFSTNRAPGDLELRPLPGISRLAMLPVTVQYSVAMLAYAVNERMARRVECLQEEVRVLKETLAVATG